MAHPHMPPVRFPWPKWLAGGEHTVTEGGPYWPAGREAENVRSSIRLTGKKHGYKAHIHRADRNSFTVWFEPLEGAATPAPEAVLSPAEASFVATLPTLLDALGWPHEAADDLLATFRKWQPYTTPARLVLVVPAA